MDLNKIPDIIIAVDGYSSTGKSTFAKLVASHANFIYLDSGALYRAVTLYALRSGFIAGDGTIDEAALEGSLDGLDVSFRTDENGTSSTFIADSCVEKEIRSLEISSHVSPIAAIPFVRAFVDRKLREFAAAGRVVMDGRDIGTAVFPNAELKIFMDADKQVRAQRRFDELVSKGENPVFEDVLANLEERDYIDSHRETNPLRQAEDAYVLDNSDMTLKEEIVWFEGLVQGKFGILE